VVREVVEEAAVSVMAVKKTLMSDNSVSFTIPVALRLSCDILPHYKISNFGVMHTQIIA
jgi:hypothetical protein